MDVYRMDRNNPVTAAFMPYVVARAMRFCTEFETETNPVSLGNHLWSFYASGDPRLGLWVVVTEFTIVAHVLAQPEPMSLDPNERSYILIRQAQVNPKVDARKHMEHIMHEIETWAETFGITRLMMCTHRKASVFSRRWGFREHKIIMEKNIGRNTKER
jgi:hypothetical protein